MKLSPAQHETSFNGCQLSIQLNGLNVLTIDRPDFIKAILSFISQREKKEDSK
ncbi:MAG: hypothetical protein RBT70_04730 [Alphaproteobacteria bacterium]|nr:hypothetical protein [Alphaproteobacteria bacterium]